MKKGFSGMPVMAIVFTFALLVFATIPLAAQSELEGTWTHYFNFDSRAAAFIFSGENFIYKQGDVVIVEGTFTITTSKNNTTLNLNGTNGTTVTMAYNMKDGALNFPTQPKSKNWPYWGGLWYGQYQKTIPQNNLDGT